MPKFAIFEPTGSRGYREIARVDVADALSAVQSVSPASLGSQVVVVPVDSAVVFSIVPDSQWASPTTLRLMDDGSLVPAGPDSPTPS